VCRTVLIAESFPTAEKNCLSLRMEAVRPSKCRNPLAQRHSVTPQRNWYFWAKYVHEEVKGRLISADAWCHSARNFMSSASLLSFIRKIKIKTQRTRISPTVWNGWKSCLSPLGKNKYSGLFLYSFSDVSAWN
jgi:hypothetical protein